MKYVAHNNIANKMFIRNFVFPVKMPSKKRQQESNRDEERTKKGESKQQLENQRKFNVS